MTYTPGQSLEPAARKLDMSAKGPPEGAPLSALLFSSSARDDWRAASARVASNDPAFLPKVHLPHHPKNSPKDSIPRQGKLHPAKPPTDKPTKGDSPATAGRQIAPESHPESFSDLMADGIKATKQALYHPLDALQRLKSLLTGTLSPQEMPSMQDADMTDGGTRGWRKMRPGEIKKELEVEREHPATVGKTISGVASVYGGSDDKFAGAIMANGKCLDPAKLTAASRTLPLGTEVSVTNPYNGRKVTLTITDRGPYIVDHAGNPRVLDLTPAAAHALGFDGGTEYVTAKVTKLGDGHINPDSPCRQVGPSHDLKRLPLHRQRHH